MRFRCATFALMFMVLAIAALAHGDKKHVTGTIDKISADSVVVKTSEGALVEVKLVASTVYTLHAGQNDQPAQYPQQAHAGVVEAECGVNLGHVQGQAGHSEPLGGVGVDQRLGRVQAGAPTRVKPHPGSASNLLP